MNSIFLYRFFRGILGIFSSTLQANMFEWGVQKRIFEEETKTYDNLQVSFWDNVLTTPIGVASELNINESTTDLLIQQGAGFGTLGSYTLAVTPEHHQKIYFYSGRKLRFLSQYMAKRNITMAEKKLLQRRHLPHFVGISIVSFNAEDMRVNQKEIVPRYLNEFQLMTQKTAPYCDYLVIDISTPMMPLYNLISDESSMIPLIEQVQETAQIAAPISMPKIVLKVPFDLSALEVKAISQICLRTGIDAIMIGGAASLHKNSKWLKSKKSDEFDMNTFMTGRSLMEEQIRLLKTFRKCTNGYMPLIASGTAVTGQDVFDLLANGACLVEAGAAFYVRGADAVQQMNAELSRILRQKKIRTIAEVIGMNAPVNPNLEIQELFD